MLSLQEYNGSKDAKGLIQKMFEARQVAHNFHLNTKSFSEHEALGGFYESMLGFADEFAETYQGQYGLVGDINIQIKPVDDAVGYLEDCVKLFSVGKDSLKDSHLKNIMEEVISLTYRTIYKLKFLK